MRRSSLLRAAISSTGSCCRAPLPRLAHDISPAPPMLSPALARITAASTVQPLQHLRCLEALRAAVLLQAPAPASHGGGLTTGQEWAIALGAVLFGMAVKVCELPSLALTPCSLQDHHLFHPARKVAQPRKQHRAEPAVHVQCSAAAGSRDGTTAKRSARRCTRRPPRPDPSTGSWRSTTSRARTQASPACL